MNSNNNNNIHFAINIRSYIKRFRRRGQFLPGIQFSANTFESLRVKVSKILSPPSLAYGNVFE